MVLAGCGFAPPSPAVTEASELLGTWVAVSDEVDSSATIELRSDGTARFEDVPQGPLSLDLVEERDPDWGLTVSTSGTWELTDDRASGYPFVLLFVEPSKADSYAGSGTRLLVDKNHHPAQVFLQYGPEREHRLNFEKEAQ
jgi:hypothetical protein